MISFRRISSSRLRQHLLRGALGGLVATIGMTVYRIPIFRALPPTAEFWARYVGGGDAEDHPIPGLVLHLVYGAFGGAAFGVLTSVIDIDAQTRREWTFASLGLLYGFVLSVIGSRIVLVRVLGQELQPEHATVFHVGHAIYGLTLGTFVATRESLGDVYDESERTRPPTEKQSA